MPKPRIFISHSTSGKPADYAQEKFPSDAERREALEAREHLAKEVCDGLATRLAAGGTFAVLLDRQGIKPGDAWYAKLNVWVSGCDAAVILLTQRALESDYVKYEVSVLANRYQKTGKAFPLLPVHLPPVDEKAIDATALRATRVTDVQAIKVPHGKGAEAIVDAIEAQLAAVVHGETPLDVQIGIVADILRSVPPNIIGQEVKALAMDLGDWDFADDGPRRRLAAKLMGAGLDAGVAVLERLDHWLSKQGADDLLEIINRVGSGWVPPRAVSDLRDASLAQKSVAATLSNPLAADMYLWQAHPTFKTYPGPPVAQVAAITGAQRRPEFLASLEAQIARQLVTVSALKARTPEEALTMLALRVKRGANPIFVLLPKEGLDGPTLGALQAKKEFKGLVFFVLCGPRQPGSAFLNRGGLTFLEPALEKGAEERYCLSYTESRLALGRADTGAAGSKKDQT